MRRRRSGYLLGELRAAVRHTLLSLQRKEGTEAQVFLLSVLPGASDDTWHDPLVHNSAAALKRRRKPGQPGEAI